jgi:hypothetical protein
VATRKKADTPDGEPIPEGTVWLSCDGQAHHVTIGSEAHQRLADRGATVLAGDEQEADKAVGDVPPLAPVGEPDGDTLT